MNSVVIQAPTTQTGAFNGSVVDLAAAGVPAGVDWTIDLEIAFLSAGGVPRFAFVDASGLAGPTFSCIGPIYSASQPYGSKKFSIKKEDWPALAIGGAGSTLQLNLLSLDGMSPSVRYSASIVF